MRAVVESAARLKGSRIIHARRSWRTPTLQTRLHLKLNSEARLLLRVGGELGNRDPRRVNLCCDGKRPCTARD